MQTAEPQFFLTGNVDLFSVCYTLMLIIIIIIIFNNNVLWAELTFLVNAVAADTSV